MRLPRRVFYTSRNDKVLRQEPRASVGLSWRMKWRHLTTSCHGEESFKTTWPSVSKELLQNSTLHNPAFAQNRKEAEDSFLTFLLFFFLSLIFFIYISITKFSSCSLNEILTISWPGTRQMTTQPYCLQYGSMQPNFGVLPFLLLKAILFPYLGKVWGVGRLCLPVRGSREPRLGKCSDLRFLYMN